MRNVLRWVLCAVTVWPTVATAGDEPPTPWNEPEGYRGVKWGVSLQEATEILVGTDCMCGKAGEQPHLCKARPETDPKKIPEERSCFGQFSISEVKVTNGLLFVDDRFQGVAMSFDSDKYEALREVFIAKYGPPTKRGTEQVQNRMGAKFEKEALAWKGKTVEVYLTRYGSKLTEGHASIWTAEYAARVQAQAAAEKAKRKDAF